MLKPWRQANPHECGSHDPRRVTAAWQASGLNAAPVTRCAVPGPELLSDHGEASAARSAAAAPFYAPKASSGLDAATLPILTRSPASDIRPDVRNQHGTRGDQLAGRPLRVPGSDRRRVHRRAANALPRPRIRLTFLALGAAIADPGAKTKTAVLQALSGGDALTAGQVATATGLGRGTVSTTLSKLAKSGEVIKAARGYQLAGQPTPGTPTDPAVSAENEQPGG